MSTTDAPNPAEAHPQSVDFAPLALIGAIILPGLGHALRGEVHRGIAAAIGVLTLFLGGLLVGGVDVVDSKEDQYWFFGQALVGPLAFGVDHYHQNYLKVIDERSGREVRRTAYPTEGRDPAGRPIVGGNPPNTKSVTKLNELGMLTCCLAGMMNLIVIIDAGWPTRRRTAGGGS
jgi:hypothetical protein